MTIPGPHPTGRVAATLFGAMLLTACPGPGVTDPDEPSNGQPTAPAIEALVAASQTMLWTGDGGTGRMIATLHQGIEVEIVTEGSGWVEITTRPPIVVRGWVKERDLGCRVAEETLLTNAPSAAGTEESPRLRPGAMLRVLEGTDGDGWLHVETAPEPFTFYEKGPSYKDPVLTQVRHGGLVREGWVPPDSCSTTPKPFYPRAPKDGTLGIIEKETAVYADPGGVSGQLPGKVLPWTRWVTFAVDGLWVRGRTDGQVVVEGWVPLDRVGKLPNTNPLNKLAEKKLKDFEVLTTSPLLDAKGRELTLLPGGQEIVLQGEDARGCEVATVPPVVVEGWMDCDDIRNLSVLPEAAIEYSIIDGGTYPPERGPVPNPLPAWPEDTVDEVP